MARPPLGLHGAQLFESGTSAMTISLERGAREKVNKNGSCIHGDVRTLCKAGQLKEALHILNQGGIFLDSHTYLCLLQECIKTRGLAEGKQVHAHIIRSRFKPNVFLLNSIVNMYVKCGSVVDARLLFLKMPERDVFTWNILLTGYAKHGSHKEAFEIYKQMLLEGVTPNTVTFICILKVCCILGALQKGKEVHDEIIKAGIRADVILQTALATMYAKCGNMKDARQVFDNMPQKDVVSWTAMIAGYAQHGSGMEALNLYQQMIRQGVMPSKVTFICVLNACASLAALEQGKKVHADIIEAGIAPDVNLENTVADMYAKCGSMKDAHQVFTTMSARNAVSWNVMIAGYSKNECGREALEMYEEMRQEGVMPDKVTFICMLHACASLRTLEKGKWVHADIIRSGIASSMKLENTLVDMYAKCGSTEDARQVFDNMAKRNVVSWNVLIRGYSQHGCDIAALRTYQEMRQEGGTPDKVTFICVLNACASLAALEKGKEVHADITKAGIQSYINLENTLVSMYAKCGSMEDAQQVFHKMAERNVISWNAMIAGYSQHGRGREAFETYEEMMQAAMTPDRVTFICVLNACASLAALGKGKVVHANIIKAGIAPDIILETALTDMYAKCGSMNDAHQVFENMAERNVVSWNVMIAGYCQHGCAREALELFEQMQQEGLKPNVITFTSVISACSCVGLVDEGCHYFNSISVDHGLSPTVEHFGCMVDLLGRAGQLGKAEDFICNMPIEPDDLVWRTLLGACRYYDDIELAEHAAKCLLKLDPQDAAAY